MIEAPNPNDYSDSEREDPDQRTQMMRDMLMQIDKDAGEHAMAARYVRGEHKLPNVPKTARVEVKEIADRATMNLIPLLIGVPSQISFIDGYRVDEDLHPQEWQVWENSGMASKQTVAFRSALTYGQSFLALEDLHTKKPQLKLLSTKDTVAFYHDPVNDRFPVCAMTIRKRPGAKSPGMVVFYSEQDIAYYEWSLGTEGNANDEFNLIESYPHSTGHCPVGRLLCQMDDEGQVRGLVRQMIPMQDRVNQTSFDLLVTQTFSSFKVRWASGMLGDPVYEDEAKTIPKTDADGNQIYRAIPIDQSTWVTTDDPAAKMGTLDETPLDGFLQAFDVAVRHFAVVGQLPPHNLLGNMSNVTAETLVSAMSQTMRFAHVLKTSWGQTITDLLGLAAISMDLRDSLDDYGGEPRWRDMSDNTLAAVVDALGKAAQMLDIPKRSLWTRFPGATQGEVMEWEAAADELSKVEEFEDLDSATGAAQRESTGQSTPTPLEAFGGVPGRQPTNAPTN